MYQNNTKMTDVDILNMLIKTILDKLTGFDINTNKEIDKENKSFIDYVKILIQIIKIKNSIDENNNDINYENIITMIKEGVKLDD
jgi:hypothetical protein